MCGWGGVSLPARRRGRRPCPPFVPGEAGAADKMVAAAAPPLAAGPGGEKNRPGSRSVASLPLTDVVSVAAQRGVAWLAD